MALTSNDIKSIQRSLADIVGPQFEAISQQFTTADAKLTSLQQDFEKASEAAERKFQTAFMDIAITREELHVVKRMVSEHGYRLAKLENLYRNE